MVVEWVDGKGVKMMVESLLESDYSKYRGKCKEFVDELVKSNKALRAVRGFYYCPIWNKEEQHWWAEDESGNIHDPTKKQFASKGVGEYREFDGTLECEICKKTFDEGKPGSDCGPGHVVCSGYCYCRMVGITQI